MTGKNEMEAIIGEYRGASRDLRRAARERDLRLDAYCAASAEWAETVIGGGPRAGALAELEQTDREMRLAEARMRDAKDAWGRVEEAMWQALRRFSTGAG